MRSFFLVWREWNERSPAAGCNEPKFRHETYATAKREAERLARKNPGARFFVVKTLSVVEKPHRPITTELHDPEWVPDTIPAPSI
jgi:hypothetical protein